MKVLAIGNSFSVDAFDMLHAVAKSAGVDMKAATLFIGGCPLERHAANVKSDAHDYWYYLNGEKIREDASVKEALAEDEWDVVTVQQASHYSGISLTYEPYGRELIDYVKKYAPRAKIYFHQTWAYEVDSAHEGFANYSNSQQKMYIRILEASERFAREHNIPVIPCARVFQDLRSKSEFNYIKGGRSLNRDGFHASLDYGRYALAATWFETLTGKSIYNASFAPEGADEKLIEIIKYNVHRICSSENPALFDVPYDDKSPRNIMDIYLPDGEYRDVLVYFHGGGLETGDKVWHQNSIKRFNDGGIAVVSANYRLLPDAKFPDFLEDAAKAVSTVKSSEYGTDKRIFVGGSSAGAYITAMLAYDPGYLAAHGIKNTEIAGFVINSSQMTTHFNILGQRGVSPKRIACDEAAPVYFLDEGMEFPNALILVADNDMPVRYEQNLMFCKTLEHIGCPADKYRLVVMENATHCSYDGEERFTDTVKEFIENN